MPTQMHMLTFLFTSASFFFIKKESSKQIWLNICIFANREHKKTHKENIKYRDI